LFFGDTFGKLNRVDILPKRKKEMII